MDLNTFISENYIVIIVIGVITIMTIIGYFAQKTEFGKKVSEKNKKNKENNESIENSNIELLDENISNAEEKEVENLDILDTIAPNFNDGDLMIGDVNQNPDISNEQLGIQEDLYAPFGDANLSNDARIEDLKIEEVEELDDFSIIENDVKNETESVDESLFVDINQSLDNKEDISIDEIVIEEIDNSEIKEAENTELNKINEEINNIVDNTFVINDATSDFDITSNKIDDDTQHSVKDESKIKNFSIDESELQENEEIDYEIEATTSLKLDEINEKIKNLKLEDLDNLNFEEPIIKEKKKTKKNKKISVKSVDEIKKEKEVDTVSDTIEETNEGLQNNDFGLELPDLDSLEKSADTTNDLTVDETDNIWNF